MDKREKTIEEIQRELNNRKSADVECLEDEKPIAAKVQRLSDPDTKYSQDSPEAESTREDSDNDGK